MTSGSDRAARIGWIGTGRMGYQLARRLLDAGCDVSIWNRTRSRAEPLTAFGATVVDSPSDLSDRDIVFTMVAGSDDFKSVTIGPDGVLSRPGSAPAVMVDSTTVSADASKSVREVAGQRGVMLLAAPVSGNPKVVKAGRLSVVASGPRPAFEAALPYLELFGDGVTYVGDGDAARLVKICHNLFLGVVVQSMAEITVLAERGGVSRAAFLEFLNNSVMGSVFTRYKSPAFVHLDYAPTFTPVLLRKDFDLGLAAARELDVPMPLAAATAQLVQASVSSGRKDEDFAILLDLQAAAAGLDIKPEETEVDDGLGEAQ
ncbi:MAG: NAD(P)-dependent oxidoreductase [Gaiellales bacterium]